jgi:hypothetical protein
MLFNHQNVDTKFLLAAESGVKHKTSTKQNKINHANS